MDTKVIHKAVPMRTCIGTGVKKIKSELIRIVRVGTEGNYQVKVDTKGKIAGRGASIDTNLAAFEMAIKKNAIPRSLKLDRKLSDSEVEQLKVDFLSAIEQKEFRPNNKPVRLKVKLSE